MQTFTIRFKFTDYRWNADGDSIERTITNIPADKVFDCVRAEYIVFDFGSYATLTLDLATHIYYYDAKCYNGGCDFE